MTDDKRPREFCLKGSKLFETTNGAWTKVIEAVEPDEFKLVERSAFDALAKENAALKHELKMCAARAQENAQLNTELLNTKELSSKLVEENAALKVEVDMKEYELFVHEERANKFLDETVALEDALKIEREICGVLREALERANYQNDYYDQKPHKAIELVYSNREALAREKEMRK